MLEGWSVNALVTVQSGFPWNPSDTTTFDWLGTGENGNSGIGLGTTQFWNYSGPKSAFTVNSANPIPCWTEGTVKGCTSGTANAQAAAAWATCQTAAQAPYAGNATLQGLALAALASASGACYMQNGGILTPPAFGTVGNASRGIFTGPNFRNVDFSVAKIWKLKERYTAQFRLESVQSLQPYRLRLVAAPIRLQGSGRSALPPPRRTRPMQCSGRAVRATSSSA